MASKPTDLARWATGGGAEVTEPASGKKDVGWVDAEKPPHNTFNWLANRAHQWFSYLSDLVFDVTDDPLVLSSSTGAGSQVGLDVSNDEELSVVNDLGGLGSLRARTAIVDGSGGAVVTLACEDAGVLRVDDGDGVVVADDLQHGTRTVFIPPGLGAAALGSPVYIWDSVAFSAGTERWDLPLQLVAGDVIRSVRFYFTGGSTGSKSFVVERRDPLTGTITSVASTTSTSNATRTSILISDVDHTVLAGHNYRARMDSAAVDNWYGIEITYDRRA